ncbi:hypothetical protein BU24DRAFT_473915 [Aaosphaeria arxii CBS 175.79]|uniref:Uncharacterized protein n=1 Tax=Aaosphaeria arxii CBS 175.79 TaxID=1450172 RepID=A0A6A5X9W8_9PLEO|nr:uncharacterized protein BU24DRAFT_473915 [Aaosphaeria arxii CBS 175.79]KAF2009733.1 hypothetical protein BU24DRAFT_473915 [Aaosphaeria arxii CBS 175.79]
MRLLLPVAAAILTLIAAAPAGTSGDSLGLTTIGSDVKVSDVLDSAGEAVVDLVHELHSFTAAHSYTPKRGNDPPPEAIQMNVTLGQQRSNVGNLSPKQVGDAITTALKYLCVKKPCRNNERYRVNVPWMNSKNIIELGYLDIWLERSRYSSERELNPMIEIAATYGSTAVGVDLNCYMLFFAPPYLPARFCNMGNFIEININDGFASLAIRFEANKPTFGWFVCPLVMPKVAQVAGDPDRLLSLGRYYGWPVASNTVCTGPPTDSAHDETAASLIDVNSNRPIVYTSTDYEQSEIINATVSLG